jgi:adenosylcobinamide-GDP ribazoletransferase
MRFDLPGDLVEALLFLTRLPVPATRALRGPATALAALPLAGLVLGLLLASLDVILSDTSLPWITRDILLVVGLVLLTGGLHLDGLMDTCDGLWGGHSPEQRLAIMRDSRVGSYGVLGGASVLLLKLGGLEALHGTHRTSTLIIAPVLARWALVLAAAIYPPAHPDGLGAAFRAGVTPARMAVAAGTSLLIAAAAGQFSGIVAWAICCTATWLMGRAIMSKIPGLTGDTYGALAEGNEVVALFALALVPGGPG